MTDDALERLEKVRQSIVWRMTRGGGLDFWLAFSEADDHYLGDHTVPGIRLSTEIARDRLLANADEWNLSRQELTAMTSDEIYEFAVPFFTGGRFTAEEADQVERQQQGLGRGPGRWWNRVLRRRSH